LEAQMVEECQPHALLELASGALQTTHLQVDAQARSFGCGAGGELLQGRLDGIAPQSTVAVSPAHPDEELVRPGVPSRSEEDDPGRGWGLAPRACGRARVAPPGVDHPPRPVVL